MTRAVETFAMVKPSGITHLGGIIQTINSRGKLRLAELYRVDQPDRALLEAHYDEHKHEEFFPLLVDDMAAGPLVPMVWGLLPQVELTDPTADATQILRGYVGPTDPAQGDKEYHIRANMGVFPPEVTKDSRMRNNVIHAAANLDDAVREIGIWFPHRQSLRTDTGIYIPNR